MSIVNFIESVILQETSPQAHLQGTIRMRWTSGWTYLSEIISIVLLMKMGRPAHCGWHHPLAWDRGLSTSIHHSLHLDCRCNMTSCLDLLLLYPTPSPTTSTMIDWNLKLWAKINYLLGIFITATRKGTKIVLKTTLLLVFWLLPLPWWPIISLGPPWNLMESPTNNCYMPLIVISVTTITIQSAHLTMVFKTSVSSSLPISKSKVPSQSCNA